MLEVPLNEYNIVIEIDHNEFVMLPSLCTRPLSSERETGCQSLCVVVGLLPLVSW